MCATDNVAEARQLLDASEFDKAWEWIEVRRGLLIALLDELEAARAKAA